MDNQCKRCLLKDVASSEYYNSILEYINALPSEQKADPDLYEKRLALCQACDNLINGMCKLCGCFVEIRAVKKNGYCALSNDIW